MPKSRTKEDGEDKLRPRDLHSREMISLNGDQPQSVPGSRVAVVFGTGALNKLGELAKGQGATHVLLVTDPGVRDAGHVERAVRSLYRAGLMVRVFDEVGENPTTIHVGRGVIAAKAFNPDLIIGLGGGSAMDCAKGANFILSNGGRMQDYWGVDKATKPMIPFLAVPTTAGTGSEAQSYALITDPDSHQKMACGDRKALARLAVLDPELTATQPPRVAAATGIDAIAHAVETAATTKRTPQSRELSRRAWELLEPAYSRAVANALDDAARRDMLVGAHLAGVAIENSMLGAAHALANPLTALCEVTHGIAVGLMLPHVVRFNAEAGDNPYADLMKDASALARRLEALQDEGGLPRRLPEAVEGFSADLLPRLAEMAARQWTATFNPRPVTEADLLGLYRAAL